MRPMLNHYKGILQVTVANIAALGITMADVNEILKTISLITAIVYTAFKFYKDYKK